jgi:phosphoadenosine phosphosulfate reductase
VSVPPERRDEYEALARAMGQKLEGATPQDVLAWAIGTFGDSFCIASSMSDTVLIHMASQIQVGVSVLFLDTGYHFAETLHTRDQVQNAYPITLTSIVPKQTVAEQDAMFGGQLHGRDPDACCNLRKVEPLRRSLEPYAAWASGIRRDETDARSDTSMVAWDPNRFMVKVNPLAGWTQTQLDEYVTQNGVIVNPLVAQGFPSIGCAPCTRAVQPGDDPRSGRWAGSGKTECGLHLDRDGNLTRLPRS